MSFAAQVTLTEISRTNRCAKTNGRRRFLNGVDGRSVEARRLRDVQLEYERELGSTLTLGQRALIEQAATLTLRAEQLACDAVRGAINDDDLVRNANALARVLKTLGINGPPKQPSAPNLRDYLGAKGGGP